MYKMNWKAFFPTRHQAIYSPYTPEDIKPYTSQEEYVEYGYPHSSALVKHVLSYNVASGGVIMPCIKIDKPLVVYRFSGNVMK